MAAISKTHIGNLALTHVGARHNIENVDTEQSSEADVIRLWYDFARQQALESHDWGFARKRVVATLHADTISTTSNTPYAGVWGFRYKYPNDCIVMRKIQHPNAPPDDAIPFEIELSLDGNEKTVLTNLETAVLVYTFDQEQLNLFSPSFVVAHSLFLAAHIAFSITGKITLKKELERQAFQSVALAGASDANEGMEPPPRDADWIRARHGSANTTPGQPWRSFPDGSN